jgi:hypothetical protein
VKFWTQTNLGPAWQTAARQLSATKQLGLAENARLFALLNMGVANTFITDWDAKFTYNFWRPVTAIRNGDMDGNDATERDAGWTALNETPMHPEYPSQAAIITGLAVSLLESVFGPRPAIPFTVADLFDPNVKRPFDGIVEMSEEWSCPDFVDTAVMGLLNMTLDVESMWPWSHRGAHARSFWGIPR